MLVENRQVLGMAQRLNGLKTSFFVFISRIPQFTVTRIETPRYVIVLENTAAMNQKNRWDLIRTALKKFIEHDLPSNVKVDFLLGKLEFFFAQYNIYQRLA